MTLESTAAAPTPSRSAWHQVLPWAVLVLAAALRWHGLAAFPMEQDEFYTRVEATTLFHSPLQPGIQARPLYYLLQHPLLRILPATPFYLRVPALLFGLLGIWVTWRLGRRMFGETAGLAAAFLAAISPWHMYVSGMARYWSLIYLLSACLTLALLRAGDSDARRDWFVALLMLVAGTATHPTFLFPVIGIVLALSVMGRDGRFGWRWPSRAAWRWLWVPYLALLVIWGIALRLTANESAVRNFGGRDAAAVLRLLPAIVQWMTPTVFAAALCGVVVGFFAATGDRRRSAFALGGGVLSAAVLLLLAAGVTNVYADYGVSALPLALVACGGLVQLTVESAGAAGRLLGASLLALMIAGVLPSSVSHLFDGTRFDYRPAYRRIEREGGNVAVLTWPLAMQREYARRVRAYELRPDSSYLEGVLEQEPTIWAVVSVQRYGIVGDVDGVMRRFLLRRCRLVQADEPPRLDYRRYRVELYRCTRDEPTPAAGTALAPKRGAK